MKKVFIPVLGLTNHGGLRVLCQIANMLVTKGYEVSFLLPKGRLNHVFNLDPRVGLRQIGFSFNSKILDWIFFCMVAPFYMKNAIVVANFFVTFYPSLLAKLLWKNVKIIYFIQDVEYLFIRGFSRYVAKFLCELTYNSKHAITVAANPYLYGKLSEYNSQLKLFNLGIDDCFLDISIPASEKLYDVIYFLRDDPRKRLDRFDHLLNGFNKNNIKVICVSQSGKLLDEYRDRVDKVVKPKNDQELISIIDSAKIMLLTSEQEGFSLPPLECMARGVIPVLFECGGPQVYAKHGENAFVIEPDNYEAMLITINDVLKSAELKKIAKQCIDTASHYRMSLSLAIFEKNLFQDIKNGGADEVRTDNPNF